MEEEGNHRSCRRGLGVVPPKGMEETIRKKGCWVDQTLSGPFPSEGTHSQRSGWLPAFQRQRKPTPSHGSWVMMGVWWEVAEHLRLPF